MAEGKMRVDVPLAELWSRVRKEVERRKHGLPAIRYRKGQDEPDITLPFTWVYDDQTLPDRVRCWFWSASTFAQRGSAPEFSDCEMLLTAKGTKTQVEWWGEQCGRFLPVKALAGLGHGADPTRPARHQQDWSRWRGLGRRPKTTREKTEAVLAGINRPDDGRTIEQWLEDSFGADHLKGKLNLPVSTYYRWCTEYHNREWGEDSHDLRTS